MKTKFVKMQINRFCQLGLLMALCFMPQPGYSQTFTPSLEGTYGFNYSGAPRHAGGAPSFTLPGAVAVNLFKWWTIKVEANTFKAIPRTALPWTDGVGDSFLGTTFKTTNETETRPTFSLNYRIKFPTADVVQKLGSGKYDHRVLFGVSKRLNDRWSTTGGAGDLITGLAQGGYYHRAILNASVEHQFVPSDVKFATELDYQPSKVNNQVQKPNDVFMVSTLSFPVRLKALAPGALSFRGTATVGFTPYTPASGVSGSLIYKIDLKR